MPCTVTCRCGKSTQKFNKLNPGDIDTFECSLCPKPGKVVEKAQEVKKPIPTSPFERPSNKGKSTRKAE